MYRWLVYVHILAVFIFLLAHGGSASVALPPSATRRDRSRLAALLDLSSASLGVMYLRCL